VILRDKRLKEKTLSSGDDNKKNLVSRGSNRDLLEGNKVVDMETNQTNQESQSELIIPKGTSIIENKDMMMIDLHIIK